MISRLGSVLLLGCFSLGARSASADSADLRKDLKLDTKVSIVEVNPDILKVMQRLQTRTGLQFVLDDRIASHRPKLGGFSFHHARAWVIMDLLARIQLEGGRWEKTESGYRLTAVRSIPPTPPKDGARDSEREAKDLHLRKDPRLQVLVTLPESPSLGSALQQLQDATGLTLTLAESLEHHAPNFGTVHLKNCPAWMAMAMIAETQMRNGRWLQTGTGYRLEGESLALSPRSTSRAVIGWWAASGAVVIAALFFLRRRLRRSGSAAAKPTGTP